MSRQARTPFLVTSPGATATTRYVGGTTTGAPSAGTWATGDWTVAQDGHFWLCTAGGSPGTWVEPLSAGAVTIGTTQTITGTKTFNSIQLGSASGTSQSAAVGQNGSLLDNGGGGGYQSNGTYYDGTNWRYSTSTFKPAVMGMSGGTFSVYNAPVGTSGAVATLTQRFSVDALGNVIAATMTTTGVTGGTGAGRFVGVTNSGLGPPTAGTFNTGDFVQAVDGVWLCTGGGTPGTWIRQNSGTWNNYEALKNWRRALTMTGTEPADILTIGDSIGEGFYATTTAKKWFSLMTAELQRRYNPAGVLGGQGWIGATSTGNANGTGWTYTGTNANNYTFGLGRRSQQLSSNGATASITFTGDRFWFPYVSGPSAGDLTITVDGGTPTTIHAYSAGNVIETMWDSGALTLGTHTVVITCVTDSGSRTLTIVPGIMTFNGDGAAPAVNAASGKGVRYWDGAHAGFRAEDFYGPQQSGTGYWSLSLPTINPDLILIEVGGNEINTGETAVNAAAELDGLISFIKSVYGSATPSICILSYPGWSTYTVAAWDAFVEQQRIVAAKYGCAWVDWRDQIPASANVADGFWNDAIHPADGGSLAFARLALDALGPDIDSVNKTVTIDTSQLITGPKSFIGSLPMAVVAAGASTTGTGIGFGTQTGGTTNYMGIHGTGFQCFSDSANGDFEISSTSGGAVRIGALGSASTFFVTSTYGAFVKPVYFSNVGAGTVDAIWGNRGVTIASQGGASGYRFDTDNATYTGTQWNYVETGAASRWGSLGGGFTIAVAPSGTAGTAATFTDVFEAFTGSTPAMPQGLSVPFLTNTGLNTNVNFSSRYVGATASGAPTAGTFLQGDWAIAQNGHLWICTSSGTPGGWTDAGGTGGGASPATTVTSETGFTGTAAAVGTSTLYARADHTHGTHAALTAADIAPGTFAATGQYIYPNGTWVAIQGVALDLSSANGTTGSLGTGVGDKVALYSNTYGFGVQASRLVAYIPAAASFAVRAASGSGNASSGTDLFTVSGAGAVTINATTDPSLFLSDGTRTARVGIASAANDIFSGTAAGDLVLNSSNRVLSLVQIASLGSIASLSTVSGTNLAPSGLTGSQSASRYVGATTGVAPSSANPYVVGDWVIGQTGRMHVCTTAGSPGTWTEIGANVGTAATFASSVTTNGDLRVNAKTLLLDDSAAPTTPSTTQVALWSSSGRPKVRDAAGNIANLDGPIGPTSLAATVGNTTTTLATSGLTVALQPGTYEIVSNGSYQTAATTTGIQFALAFSGTATSTTLNAMLSTAPTTSIGGSVAALGTKVPLTAAVGPGGVSMPYQLTGRIVVTVAGTLTLQFASGVASSNVALQIGCYLKVSRLA